jgi:hypothetical protein
LALGQLSPDSEAVAKALALGSIANTRAELVGKGAGEDSAGKTARWMSSLNNIRFADQFAIGSSTGGINEAILDFGRPPACGTVILPYGTTRITATVGGPGITGGREGCMFIGHGAPNSSPSGTGTTLLWAGAANGTMFNVSGCLDCYSSHFKLDGAHTAGQGFAQTVGGGHGSFQNLTEDLYIQYITGSPGYAIYVGDHAGRQVSESTFEKIMTAWVTTAVYQEGDATLNIHYKDFSLGVYNTCFNIRDGNMSSYGNACGWDAGGAPTAGWLINNKVVLAELFNDYAETGFNVSILSFPGVANYGGPHVDIQGGAYACSYPGCVIGNYTQNGTLNIKGTNFSCGNGGTFNFSPIGPIGNATIGVLNSQGNIWGQTNLVFGTPFYSASLNDGSYGGNGYGPETTQVMSWFNPANHATIFNQTDIQLLSGKALGQSIEAMDPTSLAGQSLSDPAFASEPGAGDWTATGGWDANFTRGTANYRGTAGTLTQPGEKLAIPGVGGVWYAFTYTVTSSSGGGTASLGTTFAAGGVKIPLTSGTHTIYFVSAAYPTSFVIQARLTNGFSLSKLSLQQIIGGNVVANGDLVAGSHIITRGTPPTVTGAGCSLAFGTDSAGQVTLQGARRCTVTFHRSYARGVCTLTPSAAALLPIVPTGAVTTALAFSVSPGTGAVNYSCTDVTK